MKKIVILTIVISSLAWAENRYVLAAHRLSTREIGITCNNGGDPTGTKIGDTLIISCGK